MSKEKHREDVYKGLAAVLGLYVFFLVESLLKLRHAKIAKNREKQSSRKRVDSTKRKGNNESLRLMKNDSKRTSKREIANHRASNPTYVNDDRDGSSYDNNMLSGEILNETAEYKFGAEGIRNSKSIMMLASNLIIGFEDSLMISSLNFLLS